MNLGRYLLSRLITGLLGLLVFASAVWILAVWLVPGDFLTNFVQQLNAEQYAALRAQLGFDRPLWEQWISFIGGLLRFDLGLGYSGLTPTGSTGIPEVTFVPVTTVVLGVLPWTVTLFALSIALGLAIGLPLGRRVGWADHPVSPILMGAATAASVFPPWMALIIANVVFSLIGVATYDRLRHLDEVMWDSPPAPVSVLWFMIGGVIVIAAGMVWISRYTRLGRYPLIRWIGLPIVLAAVLGAFSAMDLLPRVVDLMGYITLPLLALSLTATGEVIMVVAAAMAGTAKASYSEAARAKGLTPGMIRHRHAGRATLLPAISRLAVSLPVALGGLVIVERAFASLGARSVDVPGLSSVIFFSGFQQRNTPLAVGAVIAIGVIALIVRLTLDVVHIALDPRVDNESVRA